jgi:dihydroorotase
MINRRQFMAAAGAALLTHPMNVLAQSFDLIIKGGRVVDPSLRVNAIADVAIAAGRIVAVAANIDSDATATMDATGKLVVPGLLDVHAHYAQDEVGPVVSLSDGVTGWVDAGSEGADQIDEVVAVARSAPQQARILLNIGREGLRGEGDTMDLALADMAAAKAAIARNRDYVIGVKARLTQGVAVDDVEILRRAQEVATSFDLPLMIHMGQTTTPMSTLIQQLKRGDIVTHMFAPPPNAIIDDDNQIFPEVLAARRRGVCSMLPMGALAICVGILSTVFWERVFGPIRFPLMAIPPVEPR